MSEWFILDYNKQENKRFGANKLPFHIKNYNEHNPFDIVLDMPEIGQPVMGTIKTPEWKRAKQFIIDFDTITGDKNELIKNYMYYISHRPNNDRLDMGRWYGETTLERDRDLIEMLYGYKCVMCGREDKCLQIHHIENLYPSANRDIKNQVPVCQECHCKIHSK